MTTTELDALVERLQKAVDDLGDHFDSVRIIGTIHRDGVSNSVSRGCGCRYAQTAAVRDWLIRGDVGTREDEIQSIREGED